MASKGPHSDRAVLAASRDALFAELKDVHGRAIISVAVRKVDGKAILVVFHRPDWQPKLPGCFHGFPVRALVWDDDQASLQAFSKRRIA